MNLAVITRAGSRSTKGLDRLCQRTFRTSSAQSAQNDDPPAKDDGKDESKTEATNAKRKKTMKEIDEEIRAAMEGRSGDGGISGAELEGGKAVAMKRGVRDNMFRYI